MDRVTTIRHPIVDDALTVLRDVSTTCEMFRTHARIVSRALLLEATRQLKVESRTVNTPLAPFAGTKVNSPVLLVPVLRAGLSLLEAALEIIPEAKVGMIGLERDEKTAVARQYYGKFPQITSDAHVLILDPMLATGGSAVDTAKILRELGAKTLTLVSCVAAPEGISRLLKEDAEVQIVTAAIDESLNDRKFIVPGLGDFGDRYFGTN